MRNLLALSHWRLARPYAPLEAAEARAAWSLPGAAEVAGLLPLAAPMARRLEGWLEVVCGGRAARLYPGAVPGRQAQLADDVALRPFAPGALTAWTPAQV